MRIALGLVLLLSAGSALSDGPQPYAGEQKREIKALSPEEIERYRTGQGMGFGLAAELNHYPGPKHVLELAKELELTSAQGEKIRSIYERMHAETVRLGERLVDGERSLDRLFAEAKIDADSLAESVLALARLEGKIRLSHLKAHLETRAVLTPAQMTKYDALRGYGESAPATGHDPSRHHGGSPANPPAN